MNGHNGMSLVGYIVCFFDELTHKDVWTAIVYKLT